MSTKVCKKSYVTSTGDVSSATASATALVFRFANGQERSIALTDVPEHILKAAAWHGLSQKLGDAYASTLTVGDAVEAFDAVAAQIRSGDWNTKATGHRLQGLANAAAVVMAITPEAALVRLVGLTTEKLDDVRKHPAIKAEMAKQLAAKATERAKGSDAEALESLLG